MNKKYITTIVITVIISVGSVELWHYIETDNVSQLSYSENGSTIRSPYIGQETREIKALSRGDIEGLLAGAGTPFGGMAKPAELNGYPGPRHVLDAIEAGEFEATTEQKEEIEALYAEMRPRAIELGEQIVAIEQDIDNAFSNGTMTEDYLEEKANASAVLYGQLRIVHLKYHFPMMSILSTEQIAKYNTLRGYSSGGDPCENIPEGIHDVELWKLHNNCK